MFTDTQIELIAAAVHQANSAYCHGLKDPSVPPADNWLKVSEEMRRSVRAGVRGVLDGVPPEKSHENWIAFKIDHGWKYGPVKDEEKKEHPCLVPYNDLPEGQRFKDELFANNVRVMAELFGV